MSTDYSYNNYKHSETTEKIIKAFYDVYNEQGQGFLESVYENAIYLALKECGLFVEKQKDITVYFRSQIVGEFKADLVVENVFIMELKAVAKITPIYEAQIINYLKATDMEVGLLLNFGPEPKVRRFMYDNKEKISAHQCKSVAKRKKNEYDFN